MAGCRAPLPQDTDHSTHGYTTELRQSVYRGVHGRSSLVIPVPMSPTTSKLENRARHTAQQCSMQDLLFAILR
jgi:hypothetical protein